MDEPTARKVFKQILDVIEHCHAQNIIHRDLKPEIFFRSEVDSLGSIKLIDFGENTKKIEKN